jgi:hypothetical protein
MQFQKFFNEDDAADIRRDYRDLISMGKTSEEAETKISELYSDMIGTDLEPMFWVSLALSAWQVGRLSESLKERGLSQIDNLVKKYIETIPPENKKEIENSKTMFENIRVSLLSLQIDPVKFKGPQLYRSPWPVGSLLALQISESKPNLAYLKVAKKNGWEEDYLKQLENENLYRNKYVLLRILKVAEHNYIRFIKNQYIQDFILLSLYGWVGKEIPSPKIVENLNYVKMSDGKNLWHCKNLEITPLAIKKMILLDINKDLKYMPPYEFIDHGGASIDIISMENVCAKALFDKGILP